MVVNEGQTVDGNMLAFAYTVLFVGGISGGMIYQHYVEHGVVNYFQASLALFCAINLLICIWEISLFFNIKLIQSKYLEKKKKLARGEVGKISLFQDVSLSQALSLKFWAEIWATYSLFDESYSDSKSFGFMVDIGNGFSTIVPTVLFLLAMTYQDKILPAQWIGLIGALSFYQELYGTVIYFTQYIINRRWRNHGNSLASILALVLFPNIIWIVFPALGIYVSAHLLMTKDANPFAIFLEDHFK